MIPKMKPEPRSPIHALREKLIEESLDGYVIPRFDEHQGEYCAAHDNRLAHITGFTGSAGVAIIMQDRAAIFVDGRYQVQVRDEVDQTLFAIEHFYDAPLKDWLKSNLRKGERVGFNSMLLPSTWDADCRHSVEAAGCIWVPLQEDLVDSVWLDQPDRPLGKIMAYPLARAGEAVSDKKKRISAALVELGADFLVETQPDNIAWFLNVRGSDVAFNPMPHSFLIFDRTGNAEWLVDHRKLLNNLSGFELDGVAISEPEKLLERVRTEASDRTLLLDPAFAPSAVAHAARASGGTVRLHQSPITLAKTVKNPVELAGFRECHLLDGIALIRFFAWLEKHGAARIADGRPITELEAERRLLSFRQMSDLFVEPSFRTISASAANAAMCHYAASATSNAPITMEGLYLLDSGGQYLSGTTDVTRTTSLGAVSDEMRLHYTAVLKGFISLMSLKFPAGTCGHHLDAFARRFLWDLGLDYDHGTGHGVGHFLSLHEQPQRFDRRINEIALAPGMVTTIEPGFYKAGQYGMRIENQVEVVADPDGFLRFRTLTLAPIDLRLADLNRLTEVELSWLDAYHAEVAAEMEGLLSPEEMDWLVARTKSARDDEDHAAW